MSRLQYIRQLLPQSNSCILGSGVVAIFSFCMKMNSNLRLRMRGYKWLKTSRFFVLLKDTDFPGTTTVTQYADSWIFWDNYAHCPHWFSCFLRPLSISRSQVDGYSTFQSCIFACKICLQMDSCLLYPLLFEFVQIICTIWFRDDTGRLIYHVIWPWKLCFLGWNPYCLVWHYSQTCNRQVAVCTSRHVFWRLKWDDLKMSRPYWAISLVNEYIRLHRLNRNVQNIDLFVN